jgi:hypothetical protein
MSRFEAMAGVAVLASALFLNTAESRAASMARVAEGCVYTACQSMCPSPSEWITFCETHSIGAGCSVTSGGCRPGADYGCGLNQVFVHCNLGAVE